MYAWMDPDQLDIEHLRSQYAEGRASAAVANTFFFTALLLSRLFTDALNTYEETLNYTNAIVSKLAGISMLLR